MLTQEYDILLATLRGENGETDPKAFPKEMSIPFLLSDLKFLSNLDMEISAQST